LIYLPYVSAAAAELSGFDPVNLPLLYVLSNGNTTTTSTSTNGGSAAVSLVSHATGKYYFETQNQGGSPFVVTGISNRAPDLAIGEAPGASAFSWGYFYDGRGYHNALLPAYGSAPGTSIVGHAVDFDSGKIFIALNNTYQGGGNPVTGANAMFSNVSGTCRICLTNYLGSPAGVASCNFSAAQQTYSPPTGFSPWE
jgi:hypothetical protein